MVRLDPQKNRFSLKFFFWLLPLPAIGYLWEEYAKHDWFDPSNGYLMLLVFVIVVPLSFVLLIRYGFGEVIELSDTEFKLISRKGAEQAYLWKDLKYYGDGQGLYMIQFGDEAALQIYPFCYSSEDWANFLDFLTSHFPDPKADGFMGGRLFQSKSKHT